MLGGNSHKEKPRLVRWAIGGQKRSARESTRWQKGERNQAARTHLRGCTTVINQAAGVIHPDWARKACRVFKRSMQTMMHSAF